MGFLHREEANRRFVSGDMEGAVKHYSKAARLALSGAVEAGQPNGPRTDPASCLPDSDALGASGWALSLLQRAAAHWTLGNSQECARDSFAVLRALSAYPENRQPNLQQHPKDLGATESSPVSDTIIWAAASSPEDVSGKGEGEVESSQESREAREREKEARRFLAREERMRARAAELLGRALAANGQPLAALLAFRWCLQASHRDRPETLCQFQHVCFSSFRLTP